MSEMPERLEHVHLIAIGGTGMGALAGLLHARGLRVSFDEALHVVHCHDIELYEHLMRWQLTARALYREGCGPATRGPCWRHRPAHRTLGGGPGRGSWRARGFRRGPDRGRTPSASAATS